MPDNKDITITTGTLIRWGGPIVAIAGVLFAVAGAYFSHETQLARDAILINANTARITEVDKAGMIRHEMHQREIEALRSQLAAQGAVLQEVARKLDVQIALLERIEKQTKP